MDPSANTSNRRQLSLTSFVRRNQLQRPPRSTRSSILNVAIGFEAENAGALEIRQRMAASPRKFQSSLSNITVLCLEKDGKRVLTYTRHAETNARSACNGCFARCPNVAEQRPVIFRDNRPFQQSIISGESISVIGSRVSDLGRRGVEGAARRCYTAEVYFLEHESDSCVTFDRVVRKERARLTKGWTVREFRLGNVDTESGIVRGC